MLTHTRYLVVVLYCNVGTGTVTLVPVLYIVQCTLVIEYTLYSTGEGGGGMLDFRRLQCPPLLDSDFRKDNLVKI